MICFLKSQNYQKKLKRIKKKKRPYVIRLCLFRRARTRTHFFNVIGFALKFFEKKSTDISCDLSKISITMMTRKSRLNVFYKNLFLTRNT